LLSAEAVSADISQHRLLGFSKDGNIFVFEEFGIRDGNGNKFATITSFDLKDPKSLLNTSVSVEIDEDSDQDLGDAIIRVHKKIQTFFNNHQIENLIPGQVLASKPVTQNDKNPYEISFSLYYSDKNTNPDYTISLELDKDTKEEICLNNTHNKISIKNNKLNSIIHETLILSNHGTSDCYIDHHISDVITYIQPNKPNIEFILLLRSFKNSHAIYGPTIALNPIHIKLEGKK
jgi:hypothetical protein